VLIINRRNKRTTKNLKKFKNAKFNYAKFVRHHYMEKGEAYISVTVESYEDIVSRYSEQEYGWINKDFAEYIEHNAYYIPVEESVVLEITGKKFTDKEKETIEGVIKDYFGLVLGDKMINLAINKKRTGLLAGLAMLFIATFFMIYFFVPDFFFIEIFLFGFWFSCWETAEIGWLERSDLKTEKIEAGQLASLKIKFVD